jgi:two-component system, NarL family, response regulator LiaR
LIEAQSARLLAHWLAGLLSATEYDQSMQSIRVFVTDDHPMIRHGLAAMLASEPNMRWMGEAADGAEAVRVAPALAPHVVLMDQDMPNMDGIAAISALLPRLPDTRYLLLMNQADTIVAKRAIDAGAAGVLLKNASPEQLYAAIRAAHRGLPVAPVLTSASAEAEPTDKASTAANLTQRERELLALMARGMSNQDIAGELSIAMPTVKFHVTNILTKMRADNRTEAVLSALRQKIVSLEQ